MVCWLPLTVRWTHTHTVSLTIWDGSASLALQPQRRPKPGPIVEAPALLHLGRAPAHQLGASHHLVARGTALAVVDGRLPALHALTTRTRHPDPLLKTQLLTAGRERRKERGEEERGGRERGAEGWGGRKRIQRSGEKDLGWGRQREQERWKWWSRDRWMGGDREVKGEGDWGKWVKLIERARDTHRHKEKEKKGMLSTPISPQRVTRVQSADTGQRSVFSFSPNIIHPTDMPKTPEHSQTARQATKTNSQRWILKCCNLQPIAW